MIIDALATYRLTRLAIEDAITEPLRERAFDRLSPTSPHLPNHPHIPNPSYVLTCPHCASVYAAFLTLLLPPAIKKALAAAAVTSLIYEYTRSSNATATATGWE